MLSILPPKAQQNADNVINSPVITETFLRPMLSEIRPTGISEREQVMVSIERMATAVAKEPVIW